MENIHQHNFHLLWIMYKCTKSVNSCGKVTFSHAHSKKCHICILIRIFRRERKKNARRKILSAKNNSDVSFSLENNITIVAFPSRVFPTSADTYAQISICRLAAVKPPRTNIAEEYLLLRLLLYIWTLYWRHYALKWKSWGRRCASGFALICGKCKGLDIVWPFFGRP